MRVLIAEDDPVSRRLLEATLGKWGYEVFVCVDGQEAWEEAQKKDAPKLLVLDWMMPRMDGVEVCRRVRQLLGARYSYIILLTAKGQKEDVIAGLESGADDYITKPFNRQELEVRLRAGRRIVELQESLIAIQERLREQATHDALTGLWNRAAIFEILGKQMKRSGREHSALSIVLIDLDHFKSVNDTFGHMAGDIVLRTSAARMRSALRAYDDIARYGGEEFLCVVPACDIAESKDLAERVRTALASEPVHTPDGDISLTASLGVASNSGRGEMGEDTLLRAADTALYRAKQEGRNRVEVAKDSDYLSKNKSPGDS